MKSIRTHAASTSTGIIAVLLLIGAWCAPALASNGLTTAAEETSNSVPTAAVEATSQRLIDKIDTSMLEIRARDDTKAGLKPVEITQSSPNSVFTEYEESESDAEKPVEDSGLKSIAPRLPGVADVDLPRFRREMFRTDI